MEHIRSNSPFHVLLLAEGAEDDTSILNSLCSYTVSWQHHTVKSLMYTFQGLKMHIYICMEEPNIVDIFWFLPGAATFELMNMRINLFEVYNLLISAKEIRVRTQDRKRRGRLERECVMSLITGKVRDHWGSCQNLGKREWQLVKQNLDCFHPVVVAAARTGCPEPPFIQKQKTFHN